jgi:hypothetical protein
MIVILARGISSLKNSVKICSITATNSNIFQSTVSWEENYQNLLRTFYDILFSLWYFIASDVILDLSALSHSMYPFCNFERKIIVKV